METLPTIMVAPNGARRQKSDHPALPVTIAETVAAARACFKAGAGGLHAHVRDRDGRHVLDAGLYRELIAEMAVAVPEMLVQITTEAVGRFTSGDQRQLVRKVMPRAVSVALREMLPDVGERSESADFYHWARESGIAVQHILYDTADLSALADWIDAGVIPPEALQVLFVLGRYTPGQQSSPSDIEPFLNQLKADFPDTERVDWALCAFGRGETGCLLEAVRRGGKVRIGFENSLWNRDGSVAADNAERVRELISFLDEDGPPGGVRGHRLNS